MEINTNFHYCYTRKKYLIRNETHPVPNTSTIGTKKRDKVWAAWEKWLAFEKHYLHQVLATNHDDGVQEDQENDEEITEKEVIEDLQEHLTEGELQNIKAFDA